MIGLPGTGKTTFLAALWHVVSTDEVPGSMRLDRREGDQEYLNRIAVQWSRCEELERTPSGGETEVVILLRDPETDKVVRLRIPDISGELYASHWETRRCLTSFADLVNEVGSCLLFVHPGKLVDTVWITDANATYDAWAKDETKGTEADTPATPWEARSAPTQVQMVEILQFLTELSGQRLRIVLVVSAWDLIKEEVTPVQWVERRLPLLWQFLEANAALYDATYMGVSAQGGEVSEADALLDNTVASHRIDVCAIDAKEHDITHPVRWLMSE